MDTEDDGDIYTIAVEESCEAREFVGNILRAQALRDLEQGRRVDVAERIVRTVQVDKSNNEEAIIAQLIFISDEMDRAINALVADVVSDNVVNDSKYGYDKFVAVAMSLFNNGFSLHKLAILVLFGYKWITACCERSDSAFAIIIKYLIKFLSSGFITKAVGALGGWAVIRNTLSARMSTIFLLLSMTFMAFAYITKH